MSGHSKWAKVHRQKAAADSKKSSVFGKLIKQIVLAAKQGADPEMNFKLRLAIDAAKAVNMPKDNIDRAIAKAAGKDSENIQEMFYEAYGPEGIAILVEAATDNKNRLNQEIKTIFSKNNGKLGEQGSVAWMFEHNGVIELEIDKNFKNQEQIENFILEAIEIGALDVLQEENSLFIYTDPTDLKKINDQISQKEKIVHSANLEYRPKNLVEISNPENNVSAQKLFEALEDNEEVTNFYTNLKM